jgi:hypothetical protein
MRTVGGFIARIVDANLLPHLDVVEFEGGTDLGWGGSQVARLKGFTAWKRFSTGELMLERHSLPVSDTSRGRIVEYRNHYGWYVVKYEPFAT